MYRQSPVKISYSGTKNGVNYVVIVDDEDSYNLLSDKPSYRPEPSDELARLIHHDKHQTDSILSFLKKRTKWDTVFKDFIEKHNLTTHRIDNNCVIYKPSTKENYDKWCRENHNRFMKSDLCTLFNPFDQLNYFIKDYRLDKSYTIPLSIMERLEDNRVVKGIRENTFYQLITYCFDNHRYVFIVDDGIAFNEQILENDKLFMIPLRTRQRIYFTDDFSWEEEMMEGGGTKSTIKGLPIVLFNYSQLETEHVKFSEFADLLDKMIEQDISEYHFPCSLFKSNDEVVWFNIFVEINEETKEQYFQIFVRDFPKDQLNKITVSDDGFYHVVRPHRSIPARPSNNHILQVMTSGSSSVEYTIGNHHLVFDTYVSVDELIESDLYAALIEQENQNKNTKWDLKGFYIETIRDNTSSVIKWKHEIRQFKPVRRPVEHESTK